MYQGKTLQVVEMAEKLGIPARDISGKCLVALNAVELKTILDALSLKADQVHGPDAAIEEAVCLVLAEKLRVQAETYGVTP